MQQLRMLESSDGSYPTFFLLLHHDDARDPRAKRRRGYGGSKRMGMRSCRVVMVKMLLLSWWVERTARPEYQKDRWEGSRKKKYDAA